MLRYEWTLKNSSIMIKKNTFKLTKSDNVSSKRNKTEIIIVYPVYMCILLDIYLHTFIVTVS